jgi:F-type H+-transporting ATPase subunit b
MPRAVTRLLFTVLFGCAVFTVFSGACSWASAQESSQAADSNASQHSSEASQANGPGDQLVEQSREAAGEEKGENDELKKSPSVSLVARLTGMSLQHAYWLCVVLNFAVIAGVVIWISRTKLPGLFRGRTESIQKAMQEARKASDEANRRLAEIEARLSRLDSEIGAMRAAAEKEGAEEEARIKAAAEEDTRKIITSAEQEIAAAANAARRDLKVFAADLSVDLAHRLIRVDTATDQSLVRNFADQLGHEKNGSGKDGY